MKKLHVCSVCGFEGLEEPVFVDGEYLKTYEICPCCGFEFGFSEDNDVIHGFITIPEEHLEVAFQLYRKRWIEEGMKIFSPESISGDIRNKEFLKFDVLVKQLKRLKLDLSNFEIKGFEDF
ncbi:hypothetical protein [Exiguobacterium acetylicum]|uniref:hypothetical protein n=1 Tax=Exiguobacterium acetylicum TaxID=41170 RepID=UPI0034D54170